MNLDELKSGLVTLADGIPPFEGDVRTLHRRERRRKVVRSTLAAMAVAVVVLSTGLAVSSHRSAKVQVTGRPSKEVSSDLITHIDAIVVPATPAVKAALDAEPLVGSYARAERGPRALRLIPFTADPGLCALQTNDGYVVDATTPGTDLVSRLQKLFAGRATVYDQTDRFGADFTIYMKVDIAREYSVAVQAQLAADVDLSSVRYLTHADAYALFKREFADQPALVQSTKPADLPESFRVIVKPGRSVADVSRRYEHRDGVDTLITTPVPAVLRPAPATSKLISPCKER